MNVSQQVNRQPMSHDFDYMRRYTKSETLGKEVNFGDFPKEGEEYPPNRSGWLREDLIRYCLILSLRETSSWGRYHPTLMKRPSFKQFSDYQTEAENDAGASST